MTTTFYAPPGAFAGTRVVLPEAEARHAVRVLRLREGDEVVVVDGVGGWHRVRLALTTREGAIGEVVETRRDVNEPAAGLTLALPPLKAADRFEFAVEKAVELGVTAFVPLRTARTEGRIKAARLEAHVVAAMKQSLRCRLPRLAAETPLATLLASAEGAVFLLHEAADSARTLPRRLAEVPPGAPVTVVIGPEGGFTPDEVRAAEAAGALVASLGPRRLRAETAALVACTAVLLHRLG